MRTLIKEYYVKPDNIPPPSTRAPGLDSDLEEEGGDDVDVEPFWPEEEEEEKADMEVHSIEESDDQNIIVIYD